MKKEIKITIAGVIVFLCLLVIVLVPLLLENGGFTWSLLWGAFIIVMVGIGISITISVIVYPLFNWINKK